MASRNACLLENHSRIACCSCTGFISKSLFDHLGHIAENIFFLLGAMVIVELWMRTMDFG
jgi:hypothetical protein